MQMNTIVCAVFALTSMVGCSMQATSDESDTARGSGPKTKGAAGVVSTDDPVQAAGAASDGGTCDFGGSVTSWSEGSESDYTGSQTEDSTDDPSVTPDAENCVTDQGPYSFFGPDEGVAQALLPLPPPWLIYRGGPLVSNVGTVPIFWGSNFNYSAVLAMLNFYNTFTSGPMMGMLAQYSQGPWFIQPGTLRGARWYPGSPPPVVTDQYIRNTVLYTIVANRLINDRNWIFMVYVPPNIQVVVPGFGQSCNQFWAYHGSFFLRGFGWVYYGAVVEPQTCGISSGDSFRTATVITSHELAEAITDPAVPPGWKDDVYNEIGDICQHPCLPWYSPPTLNCADPSIYPPWYVAPGIENGFWVQSEWSNADNACVVP